MSMRDDSKTVKHVAAGACVIPPHARKDRELEVSYSDESDVYDLGNALEASQSPAVLRPSRGRPNDRTRDLRHSLFGSDNE